MSHGVGPNHTGENGRADVRDGANEEFIFHFPTPSNVPQMAHQLQYSPHLLSASSYPHHHHPDTMPTIQLDPNLPHVFPHMYYHPSFLYTHHPLHFSNFQPSQESQQQAEAPGPSQASQVPQKAEFPSYSAPGRGIPLQTVQPTMLQPETNPEMSRFLPRYVRETNVEKLAEEVNPPEFREPPRKSRFFVIKSYSEEDVHKAIKYSIWSSSSPNNDALDKAYSKLCDISSNSSAASTPSSTNADYLEDSPAFLGPKHPMVYLFFSVNSSGHFCGVARLASNFKKDLDAGVWCQDKWKGLFYIRWLYVKDVPNQHLRHIRLPSNDNKPVTNTRDGFEVDFDNGVKVLKVIHHHKYTTMLFDDYEYYDRLEKEKNNRKGRN